MREKKPHLAFTRTKSGRSAPAAHHFCSSGVLFGQYILGNLQLCNALDRMLRLHIFRPFADGNEAAV